MAANWKSWPWLRKCLSQIVYGFIFGIVFGTASGILATGGFSLPYIVKGALSFTLCSLLIVTIVTLFGFKR